MAEILREILKNERKEIARFSEMAAEFLENANVSMKVAFHVDLSLDELLTNIVVHGFPQGGSHDIEVELKVEEIERKLILKIVDGGIAFDPTSLKEADVSSDLEERKIGGLGVHFVKKISTSMTYKRENENNVLTVIFHLGENDG